ncbi:MAG: gamma-glutamyltransferase, partial [Schleiferiaceae bacterium]|nr:gamma-glutamyltransferase [Schleiferiaceae bacterium]
MKRLLCLGFCLASFSVIRAQSESVATAHPLATRVAADILAQGGNAYDAAVATHFALAVVLPRAGNLGGGGFALVHSASGEAAALDFRETAPRAASRDTYLPSYQTVSSLRGVTASGVPGSVAGMWELYARFGSQSLSWPELLQPAILLADMGFQITPFLASLLNRYQEDFSTVGEGPFWPPHEWQAGERLTQHALAETLKDIALAGPEAFYQGVHAARMVEWSQGWFAPEDLGAYRAIWREPLQVRFKGHQVFSMPPPSSGGVAVLQLLQASEMHPMGRHWSSQSMHLFAEMAQVAYDDRAQYLGDPDYMEFPAGALVDSAYVSSRFGQINPQKHQSPSWDNSHDDLESHETTHYSILDSAGNAVAITTTLNGLFGSGQWVDGYFLNNEMDDFATQPGVPNQFGLIGYDVNAVAPGKRMLSSMAPTILIAPNGEKTALGTPGGSTIITNVFQVILHHVRYGESLQAAVDHKKLHGQGLP